MALRWTTLRRRSGDSRRTTLRHAGSDGLTCGEVSERLSTRDSDITRLLDRLAPIVPTADLRVNGYHANGNLTIQPGIWERVEPYATVGIGSFTGSTVAAADVGPTEFRQYRHDTHFASNLGGGLTYRFNRWFGVNADYRHFFVNAGDLEHVNRFATGVKLFVK